MTAVDVYVETGSKRVFAAAVAWPGWCRSARDEEGALEALASYRDRYARVAQRCNRRLPRVEAASFDVVEHVAGSATTDYGAPGSVPGLDAEVLSARQTVARAALVAACWEVLAEVVARAPASLRKGPRGGGRDRDAIVAHVLQAESAYARKLGLRLTAPVPGDPVAVAAFRSAVFEALSVPAGGGAWPVPYAARRIAWHVLDHAWEIEDRSGPA
ncbi:MAG: hypothetical protein ACYDA2_00450 [Acidimicrobiales bacterium]